LEQWNDSTIVGKRNFLNCYRKARQSALTAQNIRSGWKSTGLWLVSIARPLLSPLLLENSTKASSKVNSTPDISLGSRPIQQWDIAASAVTWSTPRKVVDLHDQLALYSQLDQPTSTQRLLFRKVQKGFEEKDNQLAALQSRVQALEEQAEDAKPRKKKRVQISPNSKFADIRAIHQAQIEAGDKNNGTAESSDSELSSELGNCIIVASKRVGN